jgi:CDP-diacylglycerol---glycerol-3-phosphate 3-phosphatidyltransferase
MDDRTAHPELVEGRTRPEGTPRSAPLSVGPWDGLKRTIRSNMGATGRVIGATGISPNALTLIGLALNCGAAAIVVTGHLFAGGIAFLVANAFDSLDGAVARATGKTSRFGAFLDSVIDRYDESVILIALLVVFSRWGDTLLVGATGVALVGSLLVSYTRARAEGLGLDCEVGWFQRPERIIVLGAGLVFATLLEPFFPLLPAVIGFLAVMTNVTAAQRVLHVYGLLRDEKG